MRTGGITPQIHYKEERAAQWWRLVYGRRNTKSDWERMAFEIGENARQGVFWYHSEESARAERIRPTV